VIVTLTARYEAGNWQTRRDKRPSKQKKQALREDMVNSSEIKDGENKSSLKNDMIQEIIYF